MFKQVNVYTETDMDDDDLIELVEAPLRAAGIDVHDIEILEVDV